MVYGKSYRSKRGYRSRANKRYSKRSLSNRSVFGNRSARSQAIQIAALRSRINRVYKQCKPECKVVYSSVGSFSFKSDISGDTDHAFYPIDLTNGAGATERVGTKVYRKDTYYITLEYYNSSDTGYHGTESSGSSMRLILGGSRSSHPIAYTPSIGDIVANYGTSGAAMTISTIAPLVPGVTINEKIYKDLKWNVTVDKNQKQIKVSTPWYLCRWDDDGSCNHSWLWIFANGLHWDQNFGEVIAGTVMRRTAFYDA